MSDIHIPTPEEVDGPGDPILERDLEYLVALGTYAVDDDELGIVESIMKRCGVKDPKRYAQANPPRRYR